MKKSRLTLQGHEQKDIERFTILENKIPSHQDIEGIVHGEINGNFEEIKNHLESQDMDSASIKTDMKWMKWAVMGMMSGIGLIVVGLFVNYLSK